MANTYLPRTWPLCSQKALQSLRGGAPRRACGFQLAATPSSHGSHSMNMSIQNNPCSRCNLFCGLHFSKGGIARIFHFLPLLYSFSDERLLGNSELGKMWRMAGPSRLPSRSHRRLFVVTCQVWENAKEKWLHFPLLDTAVLVSIPLYTRILWTKVAVLHPQSPFTSQKCKNPWVKKNASLANNALQQNKWSFILSTKSAIGFQVSKHIKPGYILRDSLCIWNFSVFFWFFFRFVSRLDITVVESFVLSAFIGSCSKCMVHKTENSQVGIPVLAKLSLKARSSFYMTDTNGKIVLIELCLCFLYTRKFTPTIINP